MRTLVVRLSSLGDIVHGVPAVAGLARARPDLEIHWLVQDEWSALVAALPFVHGLVRFARRGGLGAVWRTRRELRALAPQVALDLQGNWKSGLLAYLSRARVLGPGQRREPGSSVFVHRRAPAENGIVHSTQRALSVVRLLAPDAAASLPVLRVSETALARERDALRAAGVDADRPFLLVASGHPDDPRTWPLDQAEELLARAPLPAAILLGPREVGLAPRFAGRAVVHGTGDLERLLAIGTLAARAGARVVAGDGGALHVLALCGARVLALFGPQDERRTGPVHGEVMRSTSPPSCAPCRERVCRHADGPVCMSTIGVDDVLAAIGRPASAGARGPEAGRE